MDTLYHTSFDEGFEAHQGESYLLVPTGWSPIWKPGDKPGPVRPEIQPEKRSRGDKGIRTGEHGLKFAHAYAWFDAALYMHFAASPGLHYLLSAWVTAESNAGLACRVGIDPTGCIELEAPTVQWSDWHGTDNPDFKTYEWKQIAIEVEATDELITVFLRCACRDPVQVNAGFFDDITLMGEPYHPPTDGQLLDLIDELAIGVATLREHVQTNKRACLLV